MRVTTQSEKAPGRTLVITTTQETYLRIMMTDAKTITMIIMDITTIVIALSTMTTMAMMAMMMVTMVATMDTIIVIEIRVIHYLILTAMLNINGRIQGQIKKENTKVYIKKENSFCN